MTEKAFFGYYPFSLSAAKQLNSFSDNIVEYNYVADTNVLHIRVNDSKQRLKKDSPCEVEPTHRDVLSNLEYKILL